MARPPSAAGTPKPVDAVETAPLTPKPPVPDDVALPSADTEPYVEKLTVETTGNFMLVDMIGGQEVAEDGPTEVTNTQFIRDNLASNRLRKVS